MIEPMITIVLKIMLLESEVMKLYRNICRLIHYALKSFARISNSRQKFVCFIDNRFERVVFAWWRSYVDKTVENELRPETSIDNLIYDKIT